MDYYNDCRLCLLPQVNTEFSVDCNNESICNEIESLFGFKISENDECTKKICVTCFSKVIDFSVYHKKVICNQILIQSFLKSEINKQLKFENSTEREVKRVAGTSDVANKTADPKSIPHGATVSIPQTSSDLIRKSPLGTQIIDLDDEDSQCSVVETYSTSGTPLCMSSSSEDDTNPNTSDVDLVISNALTAIRQRWVRNKTITKKTKTVKLEPNAENKVSKSAVPGPRMLRQLSVTMTRCDMANSTEADTTQPIKKRKQSVAIISTKTEHNMKPVNKTLPNRKLRST